MFRKSVFSLILVGSLTGALPQDPLADRIAVNVGNLNSSIKGKFGEKREGWRTLLERVTLGFYTSGYDTQDGTFDARKGATDTMDGLKTVALEEFISGSVSELLKTFGKLNPTTETLNWNTMLDQPFALSDKDIFKRYYKVYVKLGLDFMARGLKYANGSDKDKSFTIFMKEIFLPRFIKKLAIHYALMNARVGVVNTLGKSTLGSRLVDTYNISQAIPFAGIFIEDLPEEIVGSVYDKLLANAKKAAAFVQKKATKTELQPAVA